MQVPPHIEQRLKAAWQRLSPEQRAYYEPLLVQAHHQAVQAVRQPGPAPRAVVPHEFSLVHGILNDRTHEVVGGVEGGTVVKVGPDGTLWGTGKYENLDPEWAETIAARWEYELEKKLVPFQTNPQTIQIPDDTTVALLGDWGTGDWGTSPSPALQVASVVQGLKPGYSVHLGDVYYMGTDGLVWPWTSNEIENLIKVWPGGPATSFALNSNHEMYALGTGYFNQALGLALAPGLETPFTAQKGTSYFALVNSGWVFVGLDTAYTATSLYMNGNLNPPQLDFLSQVVANNPGKKVVLMSHHNGLSEDGRQQLPLWTQVMNALPANTTVYWYWGHLHAGVVYQPVTETAKNITVYPRCVGHGGIPWGIASELNNDSTVAWYENSLMKGATAVDYPVVNGFAVVTLSGASVRETFYDQYGNTRWQG